MKIAALIVMTVALESAAFAQPIAEDLYAEGQASYDQADYKAAVGTWQAAYDLSKESDLLFNLAQAKRLLGDCAGAIAAYRRFVADDPDSTSAQHKLAKDLARELEGTCPAQKLAVILLPKIVDEPTLDGALTLDTRLNDREYDRARSGRTWKIAGLVTGGVGVVTIAVGLGLGHHGTSVGDEITAACTTSCDWAALKDKDARGRRDVAIGKALDVVGVAAIAGGAIFYYLGTRQETLTVAPAPVGGGGVLLWSGSW